MPTFKKRCFASPAPAVSMGDVSPVQLKLREWIHEVHSLRRAVDGQKPTKADGDIPGWPNVKSGTFRKIAQEVWSNPQRLFKWTLDMLQKSGILEPGSSMEDLNTACMKLHVPSSFCVWSFWWLLFTVPKVGIMIIIYVHTINFKIWSHYCNIIMYYHQREKSSQ